MKTRCRCPRWLKITAFLVLILGALLAYIGWDRFLRDHGATQFDNPDERFKYGSIGAGNDAGIPTTWPPPPAAVFAPAGAPTETAAAPGGM